MKKEFMFRIGFVFFFMVYLSNCGTTNRFYEDKEVVRKKCFSCHAVAYNLDGMPINQMLDKFSKRRFKKYMLNDFFNKKEVHISRHRNVELTRKEINAVIRFIQEIE